MLSGENIHADMPCISGSVLRIFFSLKVMYRDLENTYLNFIFSLQEGLSLTNKSV